MPARRRGRRAAVIVVLVLVGLLVVADVAAKRVAQATLADRLGDEVPEAGDTSATIRSFPFLLRLLANGRVREVDAGVRDLTIDRFRFAAIDVRLHRVEFDRDQLLDARELVLERIDRGQVRAEVTQEAVSELVGAPVSLDEGQASVRVGGQRLIAELSVRDGRLIVRAAGMSFPPVRLPTVPLLPCVAGAEIVTGRVVLTCDFTEIPRELLTEAQRTL